MRGSSKNIRQWYRLLRPRNGILWWAAGLRGERQALMADGPFVPEVGMIEKKGSFEDVIKLI